MSYKHNGNLNEKEKKRKLFTEGRNSKEIMKRKKNVKAQIVKGKKKKIVKVNR